MKTTMMKVALRGANARKSSIARMGRVALMGTMVAVAVPLWSSCDKANDAPPQKGAYVIAATSEDGAYLLQADSISAGQISIVGNGKEAQAGTAWVFYKDKYAYSLYYRQGDPAQASAYELDADGKLQIRANTFQLPARYTTYGVFDKYIVTAVAVTQTDETPGLQFVFLNVDDQSLTTKIIAGDNFTGNGETATLSGILEVGDKFFSGVCTTPAVNGGGSTGTVTAYPDSVWVAIFDKDLSYTIARDNRLSYASGRLRSTYYSGLAKDDNDNVYVFSSAFESSTTKPSGVLRINKGETRFDPDYFFNIEEKANGHNLIRVWHITGSYFLLQMYDAVTPTILGAANTLAVVDVVGKTYKEVTGVPSPDKMTLTSITPYAENGKIAVPIISTDEHPYIYIIDPATATAVKGLEIEAEGATAVGKLLTNNQ
jgi:hypothetical protein